MRQRGGGLLSSRGRLRGKDTTCLCVNTVYDSHRTTCMVAHCNTWLLAGWLAGC